jgi:hypothetical protein
MSGSGPALKIPELGADTLIKVGLWLVSVAILNLLVGSPVTDLYIGFSVVAVAFRVGWKAARYFEEPPAEGRVLLVDGAEGRYRGSVSAEGRVSFTGPDGREWDGSAWSGRWTLTDPDGATWWGRVGREGRVTVHDENGRELRGRLEPEE